jgi:membrane protein DedA with SNARE-associated domain/membrane-associated phospholipid phosphatase
VSMRLPGGTDRGWRKWALRAAIAAAAIAAYIAFTNLVDVEKLLEDVSQALGAWTYLLVAVFAFAETGAFVGLLVPGETVMILGGATAGQGATDIYLLIAIAWVCAFAGDSTSFFIGRRLGREFLMRHGPRFGIGHERLKQVDDYFERHGGKTIFLGRFVGFVRAFAPFIAGSSGMRYRGFVPYSVLGTGLWVSSALVLGYLFSRSIDSVLNYAGKGAFALGTLIVLIVGAIALRRHFRDPENRRAAVRWMEQRAATRWIVVLVRRFSPQLRFLWERVTPGGTFGLEFTSLMAILAVASFVLVAYTVIVGGDPGPTPGDETAVDIVESLRTGWLIDVAKAISVLGSAAVVLSLALVCAVLLGIGRRWAEVAVLVVGTAIVFVGVHELKVAVDRPRPGGALVDTDGSSFPSGHAAYATLYVWLAVTVVLRLRPGMARGALLVTAGIALAALIGLSRVYLGVHYLSDVNAGWALGAAAFSLCAAVALVITTVRHNDDSMPDPNPS